VSFYWGAPVRPQRVAPTPPPLPPPPRLVIPASTPSAAGPSIDELRCAVDCLQAAGWTGVAAWVQEHIDVRTKGAAA
jgi:hypothetical protein